MISDVRILTTQNTNPHLNLAMEDALLQQLPSNQALLFLWQNKHTVVIGAGQNAWRECRTKLLEAEHGTLARRSSGGGAVYHDMGNLNFSFIVPREAYDVARQMRVVCAAVRALGVDAEPSGRNDLIADGRKFSGNAFRILKHSALHHGTLLVDVDMEKLGRYLNVDARKMAMKGVKSVPARVVNLGELAPMTIPAMHDAMVDAFRAEYGWADVEPITGSEIEGFADMAPVYASWDHNYGRSPRGEVSWSERFEWGGVEVVLHVEAGRIAEARVFTDAMDELLHEQIEQALTSCLFTADDMADRLEHIDAPGLMEWVRGLDV